MQGGIWSPGLIFLIPGLQEILRIYPVFFFKDLGKITAVVQAD